MSFWRCRTWIRSGLGVGVVVEAICSGDVFSYEKGVDDDEGFDEWILLAAAVIP